MVLCKWFRIVPGHLNLLLTGKMHFRHEKNSFCINHLRKGLMESSLPELHREVFQRPLYQHSLRVNVGKDFGQVLLAL